MSQLFTSDGQSIGVSALSLSPSHHHQQQHHHHHHDNHHHHHDNHHHHHDNHHHDLSPSLTQQQWDWGRCVSRVLSALLHYLTSISVEPCRGLTLHPLRVNKMKVGRGGLVDTLPPPPLVSLWPCRELSIYPPPTQEQWGGVSQSPLSPGRVSGAEREAEPPPHLSTRRVHVTTLMGRYPWVPPTHSALTLRLHRSDCMLQKD